MIKDWLKEEREAINSDVRERARRSMFIYIELLNITLECHKYH